MSVVVVGASAAGLSVAETLRRQGFDGRITLVGDEPALPYDRPPLSKEMLAGTAEARDLELRRDHDEATLAEWRVGQRAVALDTDGRTVTLDGGEQIAFDGLVIATGATPRQLPGTEGIAGVYTLRTLDDCLGLRAELEHSPRVVVVGAGFIGSEVAATCRGRGLDVTVLEALPVPLERSLGARMGMVCADLHRAHGVDVRLSTGVRDVLADDQGRVAQVRLTDGSAIDADVVVVGIGVGPETGWLAGSGVAVGNGVVCDETCATTVPGIVAAGDVCFWPNRRFGVEMRLEHWTNAAEQADAAAARLLADLAGTGADPSSAVEPFMPVPYFWSDQYDRKFQFVGIAGPDDTVEVVHGTTDEFQFVALYGRGERLVGALALNRPRLLMQYRRLLADGARFTDALELAQNTA